MLTALLPPLPSWPWYTWHAVLLLSLMVVGACWLVARELLGSIRLLLSSAWHSLALGLEAVARRWAPTLVSHGSARWITKTELDKAGVWERPGSIALASLDGRPLYEP